MYRDRVVEFAALALMAVVNATPRGPLPTEIVADTALVAVSMTDTVLFKFVT
jgi:hypothetical protein